MNRPSGVLIATIAPGAEPATIASWIALSSSAETAGDSDIALAASDVACTGSEGVLVQEAATTAAMTTTPMAHPRRTRTKCPTTTGNLLQRPAASATTNARAEPAGPYRRVKVGHGQRPRFPALTSAHQLSEKRRASQTGWVPSWMRTCGMSMPGRGVFNPRTRQLSAADPYEPSNGGTKPMPAGGGRPACVHR